MSAPRTARELVAEHARRTPDAVAIAAPGRSPLCFSGLERQMDALAATLHDIGITRNTPVVVALPSGPEMAVAFLAVASCATCAPIDPARSAHELESYFDSLQARVLIAQAGIGSAARNAAAALGIPILELAVSAGAPAGEFTISGAVGLRNRATPDPAQVNDIALVLQTSGTTARAKQVPLTHANLCASVRTIAATLELSPQDRCLNIMPLFHIHGLAASVLASLAAGGSVACTPGLAHGCFFEWLESLRPTWYTGVPAMHQSILAGARDAATAIERNRLRFIRSSSAPLPPLVMAELERCFKSPVIEAYGMTEAAHQIASNPLPPGLRKPGSVGLPTGAEVAVMHEGGELLPRGQRGELVIRGPSVAAGYYANPEANRGAYRHGWFRTGDQGWLDPDGYVYITGRIHEMINRGGEKISPREIDAAIESLPGVQAAAAFGIPHPTLGEEIVAAVVKDRDAVLEEADVVARVAMTMGPTRVPRRVFFVDALPRTDSGKVRRSDLPRVLATAWQGAASGSAAPQGAPALSPLEKALAALWSSVLQVGILRASDDFFLLGGDSLRGAKLLASVKAVFGVDLTLRALFQEAATVAGMARAIETARAK